MPKPEAQSQAVVPLQKWRAPAFPRPTEEQNDNESFPLGPVPVLPTFTLLGLQKKPNNTKLFK